MPIYEYRCTACGHRLEVLQKMSDRPLRKCTECSGKLEKLVSVSAFQLKGGGWFAGDYSRPKGDVAKDTGPKDTGPKDTGTKDAKPPKSGCGSGGCGCH